MKTIATFLIVLFWFTASFSQNWLKFNPTPGNAAYVDCGNVKVPGNQITVECLLTGTGRHISKHTNMSDLNYSLSNQQFEINTGGTYHQVTFSDNACLYRHVAATYDGTTIRIYLNGILVATKPATGNIATDDLVPLRIGQLAQGSGPTGGIPIQQATGYMDEVRIWNVARTQAQIQANMSSNVVGQTGLLAYYRFNSLTNLTGNTAFNGTALNCTLGNTLPDFTTTWTGAVNTNWFNCGNWSNGVPYCPQGTAIIPNTTNKPAITTQDATAKTVTVQPGGRIDNNGGRLTVCP